MKIREYKKEDYEEICRWANHEYDGAHPEEEQISPTSFIAEENGEPLVMLSVVLTNSKRFAMPENLLSNPDVPTRLIQRAISALLIYVESFVKALEYKSLFCLAPNDILARRYRQLGFSTTLKGVTTLIKPIL